MSDVDGGALLSPGRRVRHLLLDLDGTLLGLSMERFIPALVASMQGHFRDLLQPEDFKRALGEGFRCMAEGGDPARSVLEVFLERFSRAARLSLAQTGARFDEYYRGPFRDLGGMAAPVEGARELVEAAGGLGCRLTLATNPIFPRVAVSARLGWAGLDESSFGLITAAEEMHYCKPDPAYYREILALLGAAAGECLMAGNDATQDMSAGRVGIRTFLVAAGYPAGGTSDCPPDAGGSLADLLTLLSSAGRPAPQPSP